MEKIKPKIDNLTVICVAGNKQAESIVSLYKAQKEIDAARFVLLTNIDITASGIECINVGGLDTWSEYNRFIVKELTNYFDTDYCILVQWDGIILDGSLWSDDFIKYDYIGAAWLDGICGNGGLSIRSKKLMDISAKDDFIEITEPEDVAYCRMYRKYLETKYGITYAPKEVCDKFSFELNQPLNYTFGKHGFHHQEYKETIVIKRNHALGDVIMVEPLLEYYHKKGYRVALDTQDEFMKVYSQHYFPVYPKSFLHPNLPYKEINLDMAYEIKPTNPVLQSYFEMAGITDYELRNSRLNLRSGSNEKLFPKYAIIHLDDTGMPYRNQYNIDWKKVVMHLENKGFQVFQIGRRIDVQIAPFLNTMSLEFMMFIVKGADLFIGLDSGCAQVAVGFNVPSIIFFGSVNSKLRYTNFEKIRVVQSKCPKEDTKHCYHKKTDVVGSDCIYNKLLPPCTQYTATQVINAINQLT